MAFLKIVTGISPGKTFDLLSDESVIGRSSDCEIAIDVAAVSRRHASVLRERGQFLLKDLGSRNGTQLNGQAVVAPTPLREGDQVTVCDQEFVFHANAPNSLLGGDTTYLGDESSLAQLVNDPDENAGANVMATLDLGPGSKSWSMSAKPEVKLAALVEISNSLGKAFSVEEILPKLLESLFKIFVQADRAFVVMRPAPDAPLVPVSWRCRRKADNEEAPRLSRTIVENAMNSKQAILSADAASDERFGMAQSIAEFEIRSMLCAPMIDSDGNSLGVIQVDTTNQRSRFMDEDLEVLAGVASQAAVAMDNAIMHEQVVAQRALQRDLELAARMQRALLPSRAPEAEGYDFFSYYESARQVGGDYYDYIQLPDGRFAVIVGDVAGKGVSAAILMARLSSDVRFTLASEPDLAKVVMRVNKLFAQQGWDDKFVTMIFAVVDPRTHEMTMVNAGHMAPLLRSAGGMIEEISEEISGLPIGVYEDYEYESLTRTLAAGDVLTVFTDGFSEAMNSDRDLYGLERLAKVAAADAANVSELGQHILEDVRSFVDGFAQSDDMCLACFGRNPANPSPAELPTAVVVFDGGRPHLRERAEALLPELQRYFAITSVQDDLDEVFHPEGAQFAVTLGGDGTILRTAKLMADQQLPVVGVNLGNLGFLAALQPEHLDAALPELAAGRHTLIDHLMFECELVDGQGSSTSRLGLNEVAVLAGPPFSMLEAELYVDGDLVATYNCDGLIISTPVGSTAHNLAAGGPILRKDLQAFVIAPISPHTLTNRPVVDSADHVYEVVVPKPNDGTALLVDGQVVGPLTPGHRVRVKRSPSVFQLVEVSGQSYYKTLRHKLGWGRRPRDPQDDGGC
ncbi:unnamed protein product [Ostreobium quekettii]|uniref:FHA domain-containing protein n=1 Tax=Ostreobium quekettii TaxID=121088 RepID=A0A8S1IJZ5_9CHLO|nr:unnamed protein product [Ostreobium quekettii]